MKGKNLTLMKFSQPNQEGKIEGRKKDRKKVSPERDVGEKNGI